MNTSEREHRLFRPRSAIDGGEANGKAGCCPIPTDQQPPGSGEFLSPSAFAESAGGWLTRELVWTDFFMRQALTRSQMAHTKIKN